LQLAKLARIFVLNATFFLRAFGRTKGFFWICDPALAIKKGQLWINKGQFAPGRPLSMGMPIALGSLPVLRLADKQTSLGMSCKDEGYFEDDLLHLLLACLMTKMQECLSNRLSCLNHAATIG